MEKVLGLDLGVSSIGWAMTLQDPNNEERNEIIDCGVRIVPLDTDEIKEFGKGGNVPTNVARRQARGMRRNLQRYRWRRQQLFRALKQLGMLPDERLLRQLSPLQLYALRERALSEPLSLPEMGRVLIHLNQWRGYRSNRKEQTESDGKKPSEYLEQIEKNEERLQGQTIGQYFAARLRESGGYRIRQQLFSRETYKQEFDRIWEKQAEYHPQVLTEANRSWIRDRIIYWQRPLKSAKGLVGECALEWCYALDKNQQPIRLPNGQLKIVRPKCAPKSSPLVQVCNVWESIHNLRVYDHFGEERPLSQEEKERLFRILQDRSLTARQIIKDVLLLSPKTHTVDRLIQEKGLEYNRTRARLLEVFKEQKINREDLLEFNPVIEEVEWDNPETGERLRRLQVRGDFTQQPLYQLWHLLYATEDERNLVALLQKRYGFTEAQAKALAKLDFTSAGYARKSHRALRRLLPHYQRGLDYAAAAQAAGYRHANQMTKEENQARPLLDRLEVLPKNSLRNPVVEKVLNQLVHLVNDLIATYGRPDEIRIELARELKQSAQERQQIEKLINKNKKTNEEARKKIAEILGIDPQAVSRTMIEKWKLYEETDGLSLYSGKKIDLPTLLRGNAVDIDHIIPRVSRFDDSFQNKIFCEASLNQAKSNSTAHDFMRDQPVSGLQPYDDYRKMVKDLYEGKKISKAKYDNLMMTAEDLLKDEEFLQRQLRETQYIAKKAVEMLRQVCREVRSTTGSITDFLRHQWGWDEVIKELRLPQFRQAGEDLIEYRPAANGGRDRVVIKDWDKRKDHRHHALDALVVAFTRVSHIQRVTKLNQIMSGKFGEERRKELLRTGRDLYIAGKAPFTFAQVSKAIANILISFKQGLRVATRSRNRPKGSTTVQITLTPRGALHEETVYGRIKRYKKVPLNGKFSPAMVTEIAHPHQRALVEARLAQHNGDPKKAFKDLEKHPITYGPNGSKHLTHVTVWDYVLVARKSVDASLSEKAVEKIADRGVRRAVAERLKAGGGKSKEAFKNVGTDPVQPPRHHPVKRVRVENYAEKAIRLPRGYVEPGSNHHIAIYRDADGNKHEHVVTFWDAFQRVRLGLPAIITDVPAALQYAQDQLPEGVTDLLLPEGWDWQFVVSLARNDMFVFDLDPSEIDFTDPNNRARISRHLFKLRKASKKQYWFLHHLETEVLEDLASKKAYRCKQCSMESLAGAVKVKINRLGHVVEVGQPFS